MPKLRINIRLQAEIDITDAAIWYQKQQSGLENEFLTEAYAAIEAAAENPFRFPCLRRKPEVRRVLTNRFPYRVFYIRHDDVIVVIRVLHSARRDSEWRSAARNEES